MEQENVKRRTFDVKLYETLRELTEAQGLLRKAGEEPTRDNKVLTERWAAAKPRAYGLKAVILEASKDCIYYLVCDMRQKAEEYLSATVTAWKEMLKLASTVPESVIKEQVDDAGQEVAETIFVYLFHPAITGDMDKAYENLSRIPLPNSPDNEWEICLTPQRWLAGLEDTPSELGKMMRAKLIGDNPKDLAEREARHLRLLKISMAIYTLLEKFEAQNTRLLDNTWRKGQGFKEKLGRIANFIERIQEKTISIQTRMSK